MVYLKLRLLEAVSRLTNIFKMLYYILNSFFFNTNLNTVIYSICMFFTVFILFYEYEYICCYIENINNIQALLEIKFAKISSRTFLSIFLYYFIIHCNFYDFSVS